MVYFLPKLFPFTVAALICYRINLSECFTTVPETTFPPYKRWHRSLNKRPPSSLNMAFGEGGKKISIRDRLPPGPEDYIVLGGDIAALFTYSFLDKLVASTVITESQPSFTTPDSLLIPVWSDIASHNFGQSFLSAVFTEQQTAQIGNAAAAAAAMDVLNIHHAPCLDSFGISSVLLVSCWLVSGYFNRAFSYQNTVSCEPRHALIVTSKTWIYSAVMVLGVSYWSSNCFCPNTVAGLTSADTDFIFDTFSVLAIWRFMAAAVLGGFIR